MGTITKTIRICDCCKKELTGRLTFRTCPICGKDVCLSCLDKENSKHKPKEKKQKAETFKVSEIQGTPGGQTLTITIPKEDKNQPILEPDSDPLADLVIHTAVGVAGEHVLKSGTVEVRARTLKLGVIRLFEERGGVQSGTLRAEDLISTLKGYPESDNRKMLINILEGKKPEAVKA